MTNKRVGVIRGGNKASYQVSMRAGGAVLEVLTSTDYDMKDIVISPQGEWLVRGFVQSPLAALADVDVVFVALQDSPGQYQAVQRILDRLQLPYTGSKTLSTNYALNKVLAKKEAEKLGLKVPRHMLLRRDNAADVHRLAYTIGELFPGDVVLKPQYGGSSSDTVVVSSFTPLAPLLRDVLDQHETVLVEERIVGKEATVGILEKYRTEHQYAFPPVEVRLPPNAQWYSSELKATDGADLICPGRCSTTEHKTLLESAQKIHRELELQHYSRSDFMVTADDVYFLEVNAVPDLMKNSPYMVGAEAIGATPKELVTHLLSLAI